jgi:hypothetical protein
MTVNDVLATPRQFATINGAGVLLVHTGPARVFGLFCCGAEQGLAVWDNTVGGVDPVLWWKASGVGGYDDNAGASVIPQSGLRFLTGIYVQSFGAAGSGTVLWLPE